VLFAEADVAVGVDNRIEDAGAAGNDLALLGSSSRFGPLQHGLDNGPVAAFFTRGPNTADKLVELLVLDEVGTVERGFCDRRESWPGCDDPWQDSAQRDRL